jgi:hypothetical protein
MFSAKRAGSARVESTRSGLAPFLTVLLVKFGPTINSKLTSNPLPNRFLCPETLGA